MAAIFDWRKAVREIFQRRSSKSKVHLRKVCFIYFSTEDQRQKVLILHGYKIETQFIKKEAIVVVIVL